MAKKKSSTASFGGAGGSQTPLGYVQVVLLKDREGLGQAGDTVAVGPLRARRWAAEGICLAPGEAPPAKEEKNEEKAEEAEPEEKAEE